MPVITAKYPGTCNRCQGPITVGQRINYTRGEPTTHANCATGAEQAPQPEATANTSSSTDASGATDKGNPRSASDLNVLAKAEYKGRTYYVCAWTRDRARALLATLPKDDGTFISFWADASLVTVTKTYQPRTRWNGRRGRYSAEVETYQSLAGFARFIRSQRDGNGPRRVQCHECDSWHDADETCRDCGGC